MNELVDRLLERAGAWVELEPVVALFVGGALVALLVTGASRGADAAGSVFTRAWRGLRAAALVGLVLLVAVVLRSYLNHTREHFRNTHGRVSDANYSAVQTIWGPETAQGELTVEFGYDEQVIERIEFEDPTKPALLKRRIEHRVVPANPFVSARHEVTLRQNPRRKGSAVYPGYETNCRFAYRLRYPGSREVRAILRFPLPSAAGMYDDLSVTLNGKSALGQVQVQGGLLLLELNIAPGWEADYAVAFKSRGVAHWYFQVQESRVIQDFTLVLHLPDLPRDRLNYPEGCMTPTAIAPTANGKGTDLTYRLAQAFSSKGMGIALTKPEQPGQRTSAVLGEADKGWWLLLAATLLGSCLASRSRSPLQPVLLAILVSAVGAFGYGFLGDLLDTPLGFWGTIVAAELPLFASIGAVLWCAAPAPANRALAFAPLVLGLAYPCLAGLDHTRQPFYLNVCALMLLMLTAWLVWTTRRWLHSEVTTP